MLSNVMDRAFKALDEIHSTEMAFPSLSKVIVQSGNYVCPLLQSFSL